MAKTAFIGLGVMGFPMAGHLAAKGFETAVWNRTLTKAQAWAAEHKGRVATSPADAAAQADLVFMCVGNDADVRAVAYPALEAMAPGAVLVDHTTASPALARELAAAAAAKDVGFLDAPVSGGQAGAQAGQLSIMCGGAETAFAKAEPVMRAYAKAITHMGEAGAGQLTKAANQLAIAGVLQGLAEAVHFAQRAGLDPARVYQAIGKGAAQSWQMDNRMATMAAGRFDFGFAVDWMRKDLAIALDEARRTGARLPLAALLDQFYADVQSMDGGRWDTSSLMARLEPTKKD
jgi:3-hydroxyisobutyrate dehydrogenase-like beta-hydroxyacid dehydrogenase